MKQDTWKVVCENILDKVKTDVERIELRKTMLTVKVKRAKLYDALVKHRGYKDLPSLKQRLLANMVAWIRESGRV